MALHSASDPLSSLSSHFQSAASQANKQQCCLDPPSSPSTTKFIYHSLHLYAFPFARTPLSFSGHISHTYLHLIHIELHSFLREQLPQIIQANGGPSPGLGMDRGLVRMPSGQWILFIHYWLYLLLVAHYVFYDSCQVCSSVNL